MTPAIQPFSGEIPGQIKLLKLTKTVSILMPVLNSMDFIKSLLELESGSYENKIDFYIIGGGQQEHYLISRTD